MRFFRSEEILEQWQRAHIAPRAPGAPRASGAPAVQNTSAGETLSPGQVWELSKLWYHNRLSPDFHGRTPAEVAAIFQAAGLTARFWDPD